MELSPLTAISPVDGRYRNKTNPLAPYFSEYGLIKYRVFIEIEYFIALCELPVPHLEGVSKAGIKRLRKIFREFSIEDAQSIKDIEKTTNHDVKAVEYFLREKWDQAGLGEYKEFIHFGLTSQDINNTAIPLSLKEGLRDVMLPAINGILEKLRSLSAEYEEIPMLARTHGQPASPTRLGKEFMVYVERIGKQVDQLYELHHYGKFGGATGNFNAHHVAYQYINWVYFGNEFLKKIGLKRNQFTTQVDHYDDMAALFDIYCRLNTILIDLSRDIWTYISMDYFKQKVVKDEVGSSAMPHKVNPIDFENAEGNLGIANAIFNHLSAKLPISRLQRDLTDSTLLRNIGVPLAHSLIAYESLLKGLGKIIVNEVRIRKDLEDNWAVVAEAIQTILRRENYPDPYNKLKEFTRGKGALDEKVFKDFINSLDISDDLKKTLNKISPYNYTGITP